MKFIFLFFLSLGMAFGSVQSWAVEPSSISKMMADPAPVEKPIKCRVAVIHSELPGGIGEATFEVLEKGSSSHGGEPHVFIFQNHRVEVLADGKWLGISWWRNELLVAEAVTVVSVSTQQARVLILYSPLDQENQVALDCLK